MKFTLSIEGFKCFEKAIIPFGQLTILAGANSVGKSSVVQSLLLSRSVIDRFRNTESWALMLEGRNVLFPPESFSLNGPYLLNLGNSFEVLNRNAPDKIIRFGILANETKLEIALKLPLEEESYSLILNDIKLSEGSKLISLKLNDFSFYYLNSERIGPRIRHDVEDLSFPHSGWQGEFAIQILGTSVYKTHEVKGEIRCFDANQARSLLHQSRLWLDYIAPGTSIDDANLIPGIKSAEVKLNGSKPTNVGFGLSYVLPIIVNGLIASENSVFIVENPEAHLHPAGQSRIGQFLGRVASAGVQVVIETHSEHVLNGIRIATMKGILPPDDVVVNFFQRDLENERVDIHQIGLTVSGDLTKFPVGFFDQTQQDLVELIKLKKTQGK